MAKKKTSKTRILVWAFQPLKELNNSTGYVECDEDLANKLLSTGKVENPAGNATLTHIQDKPIAKPRTRQKPAKDK